MCSKSIIKTLERHSLTSFRCLYCYLRTHSGLYLDLYLGPCQIYDTAFCKNGYASSLNPLKTSENQRGIEKFLRGLTES